MRFFETLQKSPLFAQMSDERLKTLLDCMGGTFHSYEKNEIILSAGEWVKQIGIIVEGSVDTVQEDFWGNRLLLERLRVTESFADAFVLAQTEPIAFNVIATERTTVYLFEYERITSVCSRLCATHKRLITNLLSVSAHKNLWMLRKVTHLTRPTTRAKLLALFSSMALESGSNPFVLPYTRQELADYLAVERSAMSKELSKMKREGLISVDRDIIEVHHIDER